MNKRYSGTWFPSELEMTNIYCEAKPPKGNMNLIVFSALVIAVTLLFIGESGITVNPLNTVYAQGAATLGEPFFVEEGKITSQKEIGPISTLITFSSNGTLNGTIEVTNTGNITAVSKGNNLTLDQGQGLVQTKDKSETVDYSLLGKERVTHDGKILFHGVVAYSTNSTGKLSFLNNTLGFFKGEGDVETGNFTSREWELK